MIATDKQTEYHRLLTAIDGKTRLERFLEGQDASKPAKKFPAKASEQAKQLKALQKRGFGDPKLHERLGLNKPGAAEKVLARMGKKGKKAAPKDLASQEKEHRALVKKGFGSPKDLKLYKSVN